MLQNIRRVVLAGVFVLTVTVSSEAQSDPTLKTLADRYWNALMERNPTWATDIGDFRFNDRLFDYSDTARQKWESDLRGFLEQVREIRADGLSEADRLTRDLLERAIHDGLGEYANRFRHTLPLEPLDGPHLKLPLLLVSQPFRNAEDFRAYVARLKAFPKQVDDLIVNLWKATSGKISAPRVTTEKVIPQIRAHLVEGVTKSEFYKPLEKTKSFPEAERKEIERAVAEAIKSSVVPAYAKLLAFVSVEYLPLCRETVGIRHVAGGGKMYRELATLSATVPVTPDDIHALGLLEVARIRTEMAKIQREVDFDGELDAFLEHMRSDPQHRFRTKEELVAVAAALLKRTKPLLPKLFNRLPKADCVMKEIEEFRAVSSPVAYYNLGAEDGSRPGYYYINTHAPTERLRFTLEALTYHESIPGHHLQFSLDQENKDLPKFRRHGGYTAYVEGWALYTEKLGYEIGGYADPYSRFGQLTFEMWRACRLVVDTGLHAKDWTRQQAIDFMAANTSLARIDIENEIDRYISWPGQAIAYKVGELRILQLRREAEEKLKGKFDVRAFHDALLSGGAMPIDVLETRMRTWISSQTQ